MRLVSGIPKFGLTSAGGALIWKNGAWDYWARGSFVRKFFGIGGTYRMNPDLTISNELMYDLKGDPKMKGIMGTPLFWRYGATHKLAGGSMTYEHRMMASQGALTMTQKGAVPVDKNGKFTMTIH